MLASPVAVLDAPAVLEETAHRLTKPEVLSPAGGWPQLRAAGGGSELTVSTRAYHHKEAQCMFCLPEPWLLTRLT